MMNQTQPKLSLSREALALYLCLCFLTGFSLFKITNAERYYRLARLHLQTSGVITQTTCARHQSFDYMFDVGGKTVTGRGLARVAACDALKPGDRVTVFYSPDAPENNINDAQPINAFWNEGIAILLASLIFPAFVLIRVRKMRRR